MSTLQDVLLLIHMIFLKIAKIYNSGYKSGKIQILFFLTFKELETLNSQSTQRLKINLENMAIKKIWRLLNSELIKAILSKDPWLRGLIGYLSN